MDTLAAKLLLPLAFPVVVTIVWQSLTRSSWKVLPFALGAYILAHIVTIPVDRLLPYLLGFLYSGPDQGNFPYWIANLTIKGLFTEGIQWLILLFVATEVKLFKQGEELSWQEGVLFGLGYSSIEILTGAGDHFFFLAWDAGVLSSIGPNMPMVFSLFQPNLGEAAVRTMNDLLPWWATLNLTLGFGVTSLVFNAGSSLVLFFSIQRKSVAFFLVAVTCYTIYSLAPEYLKHLSLSGLIYLVGLYRVVTLLAELPPEQDVAKGTDLSTMPSKGDQTR
ncbi:MAG: hypothetical protein OXF76_10275 [Caldilineaceae bacterium]|nr:hypothetical protein [Caldilineaceae bacterium]